MDVVLGLAIGLGAGLVAGRLYGGVWPLGRSWWRSVKEDAPPAAGTSAPTTREGMGRTERRPSARTDRPLHGSSSRAS